jgi:hypothetical protein
MNINDVVIHVNEALDSQARHNLEDQMYAIDGVIASRFNERRQHLMIVAYDPDHISARDLLDQVIRQGYHAQHCGA